LAEAERIAQHVELSLTELLQRADEEIGKANEDKEKGGPVRTAVWRRPKTGTPSSWPGASGAGKNWSASGP
jgi:hypothetical protein